LFFVFYFVFSYPSWGCGWGPVDQVDQTINSMGGIPFGSLWFDVESDGAGSHDGDHSWLSTALQHAIGRLGSSRVGIYSSAYGWSVAIGKQKRKKTLPTHHQLSLIIE
jgi:hypothetical protein